MDKTFRYRKATGDDLPAIRELALVSYGQYAHLLTPNNWREMKINLTTDSHFSFLLAKGTCIVCEDDVSIVGMAFLIPSGNPTKYFQSDWCYLRMVAVHPKCEGKGIGRQLTNACLTQARATKETTIALHTSEFQDAARHIYEGFGFTKLEEFTHLGKKYWIYTLPLKDEHACY